MKRWRITSPDLPAAQTPDVAFELYADATAVADLVHALAPGVRLTIRGLDVLRQEAAQKSAARLALEERCACGEPAVPFPCQGTVPHCDRADCVMGCDDASCAGPAFEARAREARRG